MKIFLYCVPMILLFCGAVNAQDVQKASTVPCDRIALKIDQAGKKECKSNLIHQDGSSWRMEAIEMDTEDGMSGDATWGIAESDDNYWNPQTIDESITDTMHYKGVTNYLVTAEGKLGDYDIGEVQGMLADAQHRCLIAKRYWPIIAKNGGTKYFVIAYLCNDKGQKIDYMAFISFLNHIKLPEQ